MCVELSLSHSHGPQLVCVLYFVHVYIISFTILHTVVFALYKMILEIVVSNT